MLCVFVQFWPLICQTLFKVFHNPFYFRLLESVKCRNEWVGEYNIGEANKTVERVHSDKKHPSKVTHSLNVSNVGSVELKETEEFFKLSFEIEGFGVVNSEIHPSDIKVDN